MFENFLKKICFQEEDQTNTPSSLQNKETFTPTYELIARDLESPQDAVFEAAVYYLCVIAVSKPADREPIIQILKTYLSQKKLKEKRLQYIIKLADSNKLCEIIHN